MKKYLASIALALIVVLIPALISCMPGDNMPEPVYWSKIYASVFVSSPLGYFNGLLPGQTTGYVGTPVKPWWTGYFVHLYKWDGSSWSDNFTGLPGPPGPIGPTGPQGPIGPTGLQGPAGPNEVTTSTDTNLTGILKGDGSHIAVATPNIDYQTVLGQACDVYSTMLISANTSTVTVVPFNGTRYQTDGVMHSNSTNMSKVYVRTPGLYLITGQAIEKATGSTTHKFELALRVNLYPYIAYSDQNWFTTSGDLALQVHRVWYLADNDFVEMTVYQTAGTLRQFSDCNLNIIRLGKYP